MRYLYLCLIVLALAQSALLAQPCAEYGLTPKPGPDGYSYRPQDDRCEGIFNKKISGKTLDLLQFTKGKFRYQCSEAEVLTFTSLDSRLNARGSGRGVNFGMRESYRLDFKLSNGAKVVPVKAVIAPYHITDKSLGIYGYVEEKGETNYFPLQVASKSYNGAVPESQTYFLKFLPNTIVVEAQWRFARRDITGCDEYNEYQRVAGTGFGPQSPITIVVPEGTMKGDVCLEVKYKVSNGETASRTFNLIVP